MMKQEFDNLVGLTTAPECYERIEYVYTHCPLFSETNGKREIADFYNAHDMNGIERLSRALKDIFTAMKEGASYGEPWDVIYGYAVELFNPPANGEKSAKWDKWLEHSRAWQKEYSYGCWSLTNKQDRRPKRKESRS